MNFVKTSAIYSRHLKKLSQDMGSVHKMLLFYTQARWLSKDNVVQSVFALREVKLFLGIQNKVDLLSIWTGDDWELRLAYLVDIFRQLNSLNVEFQGKESLIIDFLEKIKAKLEAQNCLGNFAILETA